MPGAHRATRPGRHRRATVHSDHWWALCVVMTMLAGTVAMVAPRMPAAPPGASAATALALQVAPEPRPSRVYRVVPQKRKRHRAPVATTAQVDEPARRPSRSFTASDPRPLNADRWNVIAAAESRIGAPYVWAAAGPWAFDCSGLVLWAFARVGYAMPRFSGSQAGMGASTSVSSLNPGDLVAWPGHIAIWLGDGRILEAARRGVPVHVRTFSPATSWFDRLAWGVSLDYSELPRL